MVNGACLGLAARRVANLIERGEVDEALGILRKVARSVSGAQRDRLWGMAADRLLEHGRPDRAAEVLAELAWKAVEAGDVRSATAAVQRAIGAWSRMPEPRPLPDWIAEAPDRVEAAWSACQELGEWRRSDDERLRERLRARWLNRRILIAGGTGNPEWIAYLEELTGADVDWCEAFHDQTDDLHAHAERIRSGACASGKGSETAYA